MTERVIVIHPDPVFARKTDDSVVKVSARPPAAALAEAEGLARAINLDVSHSEIIRLNKITSATLIGPGAVERIAAMAKDMDVGLVFIDYALTPGQQRNLEKKLNAKVIDRTGLILEIFGARARTKEGMLQVELAALSFQRSRLVRAWTHLERQRGGHGFMGGPGETQIELDRRILDDKIRKLKTDLETVRKNRKLQRASRKKEPYPVIALVGYTNAGKSTLFNRMTGAEVFAKDLLFATLDTTMRGIELPTGQKAILSDTVGFISDLPTHLVAAFRATLEEVQEAAIILHVRDVSQPDTDAERDDVIAILRDLGIDTEKDTRMIEVLNKTDCLTKTGITAVKKRAVRDGDMVAVSALTGAGIDDLLTMIGEKLGKSRLVRYIDIDPADGKAIAFLYRRGEVITRKDTDKKVSLSLRIASEDCGRFEDRFPYRFTDAKPKTRKKKSA